MLNREELEQILAVIETADPASDCAIGNDEIGRARDLVARELSAELHEHDGCPHECAACDHAMDDYLVRRKAEDYARKAEPSEFEETCAAYIAGYQAAHPNATRKVREDLLANEARGFVAEIERVLVHGLKLSDADHAHEVFDNARNLMRQLKDLFYEQFQAGIDHGLAQARDRVKKALWP